MRCTNCGTENVSNAKFCWSCGKSFSELSYVDLKPNTTVLCPSCGAKNFRTDNSCRSCEQDLTAAKKAIAVEQAKAVTSSEGVGHRCSKCGTENIAQARFCTVCGTPLLLYYARSPGMVFPTQPKDNTALIVAIVVVVAVVVLASVLAVVSLYPRTDLRPVLTLYYDYGGFFDGPSVSIDGQVYNDGNEVAYGILTYEIWDSRGWSISGSVQIGRIEPNGGYVYVDEIFDWPKTYGGVDFEYPNEIIPKWTCSVTAS